VRPTLPADLTGEQALTLFLAASVAPSLTPDELDESLPRLHHLAVLMMSRRAAPPAPVDAAPPTMPIAVQPLDPPTMRGLRPVAPTPLAPIRARKESTMTKILRGLLGLAVLAVLLVGCLAVVGTSPTASPASSIPPAAPFVTEPASPSVDEQAPDGSLAGSGTYLVGSDVEPGTYRSTGAADEGGICYWARLKDADGDLDSIIANDVGAGSQIVTIKATDGAFSSRGCATWTRS
jgi:hypothetical protein